MIREDIIFGKNPVMEAIKADREINKILLANDLKDNIYRIARDKKIVVINVDRRKLDKIAGSSNHQGIIAYISPYCYYEINDMLEEAKEKGENPYILMLDELTDDNNLANIIRSAHAFGVHGIIIPKRNSVSLNAIVAKRSAGTIEYVKVARVTNLVRTIEELKEKGLWIYCAEINSENLISTTDFTGPAAIVIGSEGYGVSRLVKESCDVDITIPIRGAVSSLNAANAATVISYEVFRQRQNKE